MQPPEAKRTVDLQPRRKARSTSRRTTSRSTTSRASRRGPTDRGRHLKDYADLVAAIDKGDLPQVAFYKPQGTLNEHPGYTDVLSGDTHIANLVAKIKASPLWASTVIIVTYDENGGFWDHVAPPAGDRWGPGSRIPAIIVSPFAKKGYVDHTPTTRRRSSSSSRCVSDSSRCPASVPVLGDLTAAFDLAR